MSDSDTAIATPTVEIPADAGTAFKDWSLICDALGQGRQSLILRKGGIAECRQGFRFKHESFFLFPTQFHQQAERIRPDELASFSSAPRPAEGEVTIRYYFTLEWAEWITDWPTVSRLAPFHVWREDVLRERFAYGDDTGLQCAFGRVYRLDPAWTFPDRPSFGGCRSWVMLPTYPAGAHSVSPVLDDERHRAVATEIRQAIRW